MSGFELIGPMLAIAGSAASAVGTYAAGKAEKQNQDFMAAQEDMRAKEETAAAQRDAIAKRREGAIVNSRAQALAAASGAGAGMDAPSIVKIMADTAGEAEYNAGTVMYGGKSRAAGLRDSARGRRAAGKASLLGGTLGGFGQAASGAARAFG